uniref:Nephrocystin 3-like N-terminal domain-containing protein n=1 Tax=Bionectria ochroleuca TaxID=29856 RepID=A0A8H7N336_BIOOC
MADVGYVSRNARVMENFRVASVAALLYKSDVVHPETTNSGCDIVCDATYLLRRAARDEEEDDPAIHYGQIASGNQLMKDAHIRDMLAAEKGILCFEMEVAGLMNHFPCLVIRGICDYSDSYKNKEWQGFAAMMAAAYANGLLRQIPPNKVDAETPLAEALSDIDHKLGAVHKTVVATKAAAESIQSGLHTEEMRRWLHPPDPSPNLNYARKLRHEGTGAWLLKNPIFQSWEGGSHRHLWLHGLAGCGKTVLSATVLDHLMEGNYGLILSFFFDFIL